MAPGVGLEPTSPEGHQLARPMNSYWSRGWPLLGPMTYLARVSRQIPLMSYCNLMFFLLVLT